MFRCFLALLCACAMLCGCAAVSTSVNKDRVHAPLPPADENTIFIRTRVVTEVVDGKAVRDFAKIIEDLQYTEALFEELNIRFAIVEMGTAQVDQDWRVYGEIDADRYPNLLSIYYVRAKYHAKDTVVGLSSFHWDRHKHGIVVRADDTSSWTMAHEVGHYLGLYHTFENVWMSQGDFVSDTLSEEEFEHLNPGLKYENYNNVMNYHNCDSSSVTPGQIERMRWFLLVERHAVHMNDPMGLGAPRTSMLPNPPLDATMAAPIKASGTLCCPH